MTCRSRGRRNGAQKEREIETMHREIESLLAWANHLNSHEFLSNIVEVSKDWESRGGLKVLYKECAICKETADVTVAPLHFGKKRMGILYCGNLSTRKRKFGYDSVSARGIPKQLEDLISDARAKIYV